ncbi:peptidoglycan-binding domain-containing protein [Streptantibioticus ferralitis]|uniref:peptidoglycan-binding domain-containing protein n=1 Tax=Streptantibioticus ferralitis TaxID=236510 RepID=UPI0035579E77
MAGASPTPPAVSPRPGEWRAHCWPCGGRLSANAWSHDVDEMFESRTEAAVKQFQWREGLSQEGKFGVQTWATLCGRWE